MEGLFFIPKMPYNRPDLINDHELIQFWEYSMQKSTQHRCLRYNDGTRA
jgi:hypothetical protein